MPTEMTVDQLLAQQKEVKPLATIEPVDGKPELVKVTPWLQSAGCLCSLALDIPKAVIASVKPTGETHYCCGKRLEIVEITFGKGAQVAVADVFAQAASAARVQRLPRRGAKAVADNCEGCSYGGQVYSIGGRVCVAKSLLECRGGDGVPYEWWDVGPC